MILYKYRSLVNPENTKKMILNQEIYFAKRSSFNDPFDCFPRINMESTETEQLDFTVSYLIANSPGMSKSNARVKAENFLASSTPLDKLQLSIGVREKLDEFGILCLSEDKKNILMWSHYADDHKGICLGFESTGGGSIFDSAKIVEYNEDNDRHTINWVSDHENTPDNLIKTLYQKSKHWAYEEERRIASIYHKGVTNYKPGELKEIIFGSKISEDYRELVMSWCDQLVHKPGLFKARLHPRKYEMEITPFKF